MQFCSNPDLTKPIDKYVIVNWNKYSVDWWFTGAFTLSILLNYYAALIRIHLIKDEKKDVCLQRQTPFVYTQIVFFFLIYHYLHFY